MAPKHVMSPIAGKHWSARAGAWRLLVAGLVLAVPVSVAVALGWLKWNEDELVFRAAISRERILAPLPPEFETVEIALAGGEKLAAVVRRAPAPGPGLWVLHLHGNADSAFSRTQLRHIDQLAGRGFDVLAPDYRGFGRTPGQVSEANMHEDAEAALQWLAARHVPTGRVVLWGHSLGAGPALELATRHRVAGVVLFGAFTSIDDMAAELYPWLPVRWVVGIHFDNLERIRSVRVPVVIVHAAGDRTVPYAHGQRLHAAANEPRHFITLRATSPDGFGGHVDALYEQLDTVVPLLEAMAPGDDARAPSAAENRLHPVNQ